MVLLTKEPNMADKLRAVIKEKQVLEWSRQPNLELWDLKQEACYIFYVEKRLKLANITSINVKNEYTLTTLEFYNHLLGVCSSFLHIRYARIRALLRRHTYTCNAFYFATY